MSLAPSVLVLWGLRTAPSVTCNQPQVGTPQSRHRIHLTHGRWGIRKRAMRVLPTTAQETVNWVPRQYNLLPCEHRPALAMLALGPGSTTLAHLKAWDLRSKKPAGGTGPGTAESLPAAETAEQGGAAGAWEHVLADGAGRFSPSFCSGWRGCSGRPWACPSRCRVTEQTHHLAAERLPGTLGQLVTPLDLDLPGSCELCFLQR